MLINLINRIEVYGDRIEVEYKVRLDTEYDTQIDAENGENVTKIPLFASKSVKRVSRDLTVCRTAAV